MVQGFFQTSCQICGKFGHLAVTCRFRNTENFIPEGCQICGKRNHGAPFCHFRNANLQTQQVSAMHVAAPSSVPSAPPQQIWLTDSEATSHMTADIN
ncbi:hypothetical protein ACFX13_015743 [Malus domestica]